MLVNERFFGLERAKISMTETETAHKRTGNGRTGRKPEKLAALL